MLETASADQITTLAEIAYTILGRVFELTDSELSSLQRYKSVIRKLASRTFRLDENKAALLGKPIAVKQLLVVFFNHNSAITMDSDDVRKLVVVPAAYTESVGWSGGAMVLGWLVVLGLTAL